MRRTAVRLLALIPLIGVLPITAQHPLIFDESTVVAGTQRLETRYFFAAGKWSDAGNDVGSNSTEIHCYKRFGFCEMASATSLSKEAWVRLSTLDILRWDSGEMIAVDSSAICLVSTLRIDFATKKVSISASSKGAGQIKFCAALPPSIFSTAFLIGK